MAWKAIRAACSEEAQNRLTVVPGNRVQTELNGDSPCDVATLLALRFRTSEVEIVYLYGVELGHLFQGGTDGGGGEVVGAQLLQRAFERASDRGTGSGDDNGLRHRGGPFAAEGRIGRLWCCGHHVAVS
jgi:hypothetical protein